MTILDIELAHFGKFRNKKINFSQGMNVVYGKNETGKSTVHAFIRCMLLGMKPNALGEESRFYEQYMPWDYTDGIYGGSMRISLDDRIYRIERNFLKGKSFLKLYDETENRELLPAEAKLKELTQGLNDTNFENTISVEQLKCVTEPQLIDELERFIFNAAQTKNIKIDIEQAKKRLKQREKELREKYLEDADAEYEECQIRLVTARKEYDRFCEQEYKQRLRSEALTKRISQLQRQGEEEFLAYDREREESCRRYEAAKHNFEHGPKEPDKAPGMARFLFFFIMAVLFGAGFCFLYLNQGLEERVILITAAIFATGFVLCILAMLISLISYAHKKKENTARTEIYQKLKTQYENSAKQFEDCKENSPQGYEREIQKMQDELEILKDRMKESEEQTRHWELECEILVKRQREIRSSAADNRQTARDLNAVELAVETLDKVAARVQETFGNRLCKEAGEILSEITNYRYTRISMNRLREIRIGNEEYLYPLNHLSRGTVEQVYLAIRVAAAKLLWQKSPMPFIFDDIFAYYDDERLEAAMNMLKESGHQTIIFSCNTREDKVLEEQKRQTKQ